MQAEPRPRLCVTRVDSSLPRATRKMDGMGKVDTALLPLLLL